MKAKNTLAGIGRTLTQRSIGFSTVGLLSLFAGLFSSLFAGHALALTATSTTVTLTAASVPIGKATTLTATVSPSAATGTVTFKDGTTSLGVASVSAGVARLSKAFTTLGAHPITAVYYGSSVHATSTSAAKTQTVATISTSTALSSSLPTTTVGQATTLTATVTPSSTYGTLSGTVTFKDGSTTLGTAPLSAGSANARTATLVNAFTTAGSRNLTAAFALSGNYAASTSAALRQTVTAAVTALSLSATPSSATVNQTVTLKAMATPSTANGSIVFKDGATTLGTVALASGTATLAKKFTTAGLHSLTASYAGNTNYLAANANTVTLVVNGAPGTIPSVPASPTPTVSYQYDAQGNATVITQAPGVQDLNGGAGLATSIYYDALRRPSSITDPASGGTQLSYDGQDNITQVTDPKGLNTQYPRDGLGQANQLISPDTGTANLTYDAAGNLLTRTDSRGVLAQYSYDAINRLTSANLSKSGQPNQAYTWTYDQTGGFYTYGIGRLTSITFPEGSSAYAYDALGRVVQTRQILNPNASANPSAVVLYTAYGYDGAGNPTSLTYPSGRVLNIAYANGLPTTLTLAGANLITNIQYPPASALAGALTGAIGSPKSWSWAMASGSVAHSRSFDTSGRLTRYPLGEHLRDVSYDAANRITGYKHYIAATGSTAPVQDQQFAYDNLGRLTQASTSQASWAYTYDANGNRTSVAINNGTPNAYTVDPASNRLTDITTPAITLTHDAMGNIVSDGTYTLGYDLRGRLTTATQGGNTTTYAYDNAGQRVRKAKNSGTADTVVFVYDLQGQLLGEYDSTGKAIREYVWLGNMPVAMITPDPAMGANANTAPPIIYYIHADHLNTPRVLVDKNNVMRWRWMSEPFGTTPADTSPAGQTALTFNLRFPGQFYDAESGMMYNYQRDYIPGIGRYAQSDPIGLSGGINTYSYTGANPVSRVDPDGLRWVCYVPGGCINQPDQFPVYPDFPPNVGPNQTPPLVVPSPLDWLKDWMESRQSGKEKATDTPSWSKGKTKNPGESCAAYAERLLNEQYGCDSQKAKDRGPGSEYSKIKKNCERGGK
jgi:RHS repeat-associated protein